MTGRALSAVMALVVLAGMAAAPLSAQTWSAEQQEVWALELASWEAIKNKDLSWIDQYTHTNLLAWDDQRPMPRGKEVFREWSRVTVENSTILVQQFDPVGIVVEDNTAVAMYYYALHVEDREGEREDVYGRCTDIWIKQGGTWLLIGWRCADLPEDD